MMGRLFILIAFLVLVACSDRHIIEQERKFTETIMANNPSLQSHSLSVDGHQLHYVANGQYDKPALIIIHGTPGDWRQYSRYLLNPSLLAQYYMIVIDRPGWGQSHLAGGLTIADFPLQAKIIAGLARKLKEGSGGQPVVLMGHSLGASIAPRVAIDFPSLIDGLLLFAGTVAPELSSPRWFNYIARIPLMEYVIGERFHLSNEEIFALQKNIDDMQPRFQEINAPVIAVQGMDDGLVYPANSDFIEKTFNPEVTTVIRLEGEGHLFPMTLRDDVVQWATVLLKEVRAAP